MFRVIALLAALTAVARAAAAQTLQLHVIQKSLELTPADIVSADAVSRDGVWVVKIRFAPDAAAKFGAITERHLRKTMQIVVEDRIISAPIILSVIKGGEVQISGTLTEASATELARKIKPR